METQYDMNDKLIVKNFGPIQEAELELKKTTVLIGPQGSGKSTLAKLVAIFNNADSFTNGLLFNQINFLLQEYNIQNYYLDESSFEYHGNVYSIIRENKEFKGEINKFYNDYDWETPEHPNPYKLKNFVPFLGEVKKWIEKTKSFGNSSSLTLREYRSIVGNLLIKPKYIPTERFFISTISESIFGLLNNQIALSKNITSFGSYFEIARKLQTEYNLDFLNIRYKYKNGQDRVYFAGEYSLPLSESASGYQSVVPLFVVVEHLSKQGKNHFIIEEPELNLYPTTQKDLVYYLANRCTKGENELLMTTHSPYVLSALNNLLFAYQVAQKHPDKEEEISRIIPKESWLNPAEFAAYYVGDGTVRSIFTYNPDKEENLIADNELDDVSIDIAGERDQLLNIYFYTPDEEFH